MQRKKIKIGEAYAVTNQRSARAYLGPHVKGTVVSFDGKYQGRTSRYSYRTETKQDGIVVRFDEPVYLSFDGIVTARSLPSRDSRRKDTITELVVPDPRWIAMPWDEYAREQKEWAETQEDWAREADEKAKAFAPVLEQVKQQLRGHGFKNLEVYDDLSGLTFDGGSVPLRTGKGTDGKKKIVGFEYRDVELDAAAFCALIGVVAPEEE